MESPTSGQIVFHTDILPKQTKKALDFLSLQTWLSQDGWYLAGGTALSLCTGNRISFDLDFFTTHAHFESAEALDHFAGYKDWEVDINRKDTIYGRLLGAKISFIAYPFFVPKLQFLAYGSVRILQPADVAVMKIIAVSQRGKKRDFFDLYWCAKNLEPLEETVKKLPAQYPSTAHDYHHILKSLVYFEDAESDPEPDIFFQASWKEVKSFFHNEIPTIAKRLINLQ